MITINKIRRFHRFYTPLLPFFFHIIWIIPFLHRLINYSSKRKKILLIAQNNIAADHIKYIYDLLFPFEKISIEVTTDWVPPRKFNKYDIKKIVPAKYVHIFWALVRNWDLIVFTNHPFGFGIWFSPHIKKLYINHGIHTGKINNDLGEDGVYGKSRVNRPFKKPYYSCMFASSEKEKSLAIKTNPLLKNTIKVTGFLKSDLFSCRYLNNKEKIRRKLGYESNEKIIHIISTWGEDSLYKQLGDKFLRKAVNLQETYKCIFSLHPRYDEFNKTSSEKRESILTKYERLGMRVNRGLDWEDYVAVADIAISDHSSMCLYHLLLNHPILLTNVPQSGYLTDGLYARLKKHAYTLKNNESLEKQIEPLFADNLRINYTEIKKQMLQHQGEAAQRYLDEIFSLLAP